MGVKTKVALTFSFLKNGVSLRTETVAEDVIRIGRDPRSHLRLDNEMAPPRHSMIEVVSLTEIKLIDLGFEPTATVNGKPVNKIKIQLGDQIQIGTEVLRFDAVNEVVAAGANEAADQTSDVNQSEITQTFAIDGLSQARNTPVVLPRVQPETAEVAPVAAAPKNVPATNPFVPAAQASPMSPGIKGSTQIISKEDVQSNVAVASPIPVANLTANPFVSAVSAAKASPVPGVKGSTQVISRQDVHVKTPQYALIRTGPDVNPNEVEQNHIPSVEISVLWETNVLCVCYIKLDGKSSEASTPFYVGEKTGKNGKNELPFEIPAEVLGRPRAAIVLPKGTSAAAVILPKTTGTIEIPGQPNITIHDFVTNGRAKASSVESGAYEFDLAPGTKLSQQLGNGLVLRVVAGNAGKVPVAGAFSNIEPAVLGFMGLSLLFHSVLIISMMYFMPSRSAGDGDELDPDQILAMQKMLDTAAERAREEEKVESNQNQDSNEGGTGTRAKGEEGAAGNPTTQTTGKRYGVQGPQDNADPHLARQAAIKDMMENSIIGLINSGAGGDPNAPTAPWGREDSLGADPMSARGNMWGDSIGDSFGAGGLGISGAGEGGGGNGEGIGLGNIGTLGHGAGTGSGQGFGSGRGRLGGTHTTKAPNVRAGATTVNGRLPAEVIQRIVRQNFGRFRLCYENALRNNPALQGRVAVRFVIDRSGAVSTASDGGSDIGDGSVVSCVVRNFNSLSFPAPEGGIVQVTYPIIFSPGE